MLIREEPERGLSATEALGLSVDVRRKRAFIPYCLTDVRCFEIGEESVIKNDLLFLLPLWFDL